MDAPRKLVGTLWIQPTRGSTRVLPVHVVLWLQQVVGNREVRRFLTPKPAIAVPPLAPPAPSRQGIWLGMAAGAGALAGVGLSAGVHLSMGTAAALGLVGSGIGVLAVRLLRGRG